jgi:hypothetical protein
MEKIEFEKELLAYLNLPSIPLKEWKEGDMPFEKGVAVIEYYGERLAYAVCKFDPNSGIKRPRVIKTFGTEPFVKIVKVFVVPNYMSNIEDVKDMDLDEQSKKKAEQMLKEAQELETEGTKEENPMKNLPEWIFPEIENKEQAVAWLKNFQSRNKQKGRIPTTDENIKLRLFSIYSELQKKQK